MDERRRSTDIFPSWRRFPMNGPVNKSKDASESSALTTVDLSDEPASPDTATELTVCVPAVHLTLYCRVDDPGLHVGSLQEHQRHGSWGQRRRGRNRNARSGN
jgi:hypothetical protein